MKRAQGRWTWPVIGLVIGAIVGGSIAYYQWPTTASVALGRSATTPDVHEHAAQLDKMSRQFRAVAKTVDPSVVYITIKAKTPPHKGRMYFRGRGFGPGDDFFRSLPPQFRQFFEGPPGFQHPNPDEDENQPDDRYHQYDVPRPIAAGSGWVWDDRGYIITNNHVVQHADEIEVTFYNNTTAKAEVVGTDPQTDIAVIKVDHDDLQPAQRSSQPVEQGDIVLAFGSPLRYRFSMSQGIVSGVGREVGIIGRNGYENFIQTDAAINPGNSGGPLTNIYGEVVGMNTAIATGTGFFAGIGFAIPMDLIEPTVKQLIDHGKVSRGFIGVMIRDDEELLKTYGVDHGAVVADLVEDGPAKDAGIKVGDVVLGIDGKPVKDASQLRWIVAAKEPGDKVKLEILRNGKHKHLTLELGEQPADGRISRAPSSNDNNHRQGDKASETLQKLGLTRLEDMTEDLSDRYDLEFTPGVLVERVRPGSVAAARGVQRGMIITHVMGEPVKNIDELNDLIEKYEDEDAGIRMRLRNPNGQTLFVVLKLPD